MSKAPGSVSGPTSSGSFALPLIRGSPQRAIHGPVRLAWRPARLPPDQRQDSAVTYVALCVVSAIAIKKRFDYRADALRRYALLDALRPILSVPDAGRDLDRI
ncbi:hypothetical protein [Pseudomonas syringae]|uniref:hypothetical protein n=1 Tax=Pseudomonas syringae TaxID=317 RepID=UPI00211A2244|nr:hypothetical protein [Pseudomonas syringae]